MDSLPVRTNGVAKSEQAVNVNGVEYKMEQRRRNDSEGGWIVQKFGGTSVGKFAANIAEDIVRCVVFLLVLLQEGAGGKKQVGAAAGEAF